MVVKLFFMIYSDDTTVALFTSQQLQTVADNWNDVLAGHGMKTNPNYKT